MFIQLLIASLALAALVTGQTPCSPIDDGPFLGTRPTLTMDVYEATQQDLSGPQTQRYRSELRLHGVVGGQGDTGIVVEVMPDYAFFNPEDSFRFVAQGGKNWVQVSTPLDRDGPTASAEDDTSVFGFTLKCSRVANMSDIQYYDAKIFVKDVNDNSPVFLNNFTSPFVINELTPVGMAVLSVVTEDKDLESNITYRILSDNDWSGHFGLDSVTGQLTLVTPLDHERQARGTLILVASDNGSPARTATATVSVVVEDGDDQGPVFVYEGCWTYNDYCAWPKYTTTTVIQKDKPISVLPVPNKVKAEVTIKAKDTDDAANPVQFSIASTIPPGKESLFRVTTSYSGEGEYTATITPTQSTTLNHGFEIFLKAQEQSEQGRFVIAMVFFEETGHPCASGNSALNQIEGQSSPTSGETTPKYTEPVIALIVVVSIMAAILLCLSIAFLCFIKRANSSGGGDINLSRVGTNGNAAY